MAAGCAADSADSADSAGASLDRAMGAVLADGADRLAEALEADDACRALLEADALRERAARALEAGDAPDDVVAETTRVVDATTFALTCEVETAAEDADGTDEAAQDEAAEAAEAAEADEADDSAPQEPAPAPAPAPAPEDEPDEPVQDGGGGRSGSSQGQGPDGDGPPGHRDDRGRG